MVSTIEANQIVHTALINSGEYEKSPHRLDESVENTKLKIAKLGLNNRADIKHLDVGCGDGFIFECTPSQWKQFGIDATKAMLDVCNAKHPNVKTSIGIAEKIEFDNDTFDVVTCYSFLDHLEDTAAFYAEAIRVLKPGGYFYFGLSPNRDFYKQLMMVEKCSLSNDFPDIDLDTEIIKAFNDGDYYQEKYDISSEILSTCEPGKTTINGLLASDEIEKLINLKVTKVNVWYEWIVQQNKLPNQDINILKKYLPFTAGSFKYFDLWGVK